MINHIRYFFVILSLTVFSVLPGCSGTDNSGKTGSAGFKLTWNAPQNRQSAKVFDPYTTNTKINCDDWGISAVAVTVLNGDTQVGYDKFACTAGQGTINNIPEGNNYTFKVKGLLSNYSTAWSGTVKGITINADTNNQVGPIKMNYVGNDTTPPTITGVSPKDGSLDTPITSRVEITFSEPMAKSFIEAPGNITLKPTGAVTGTTGTVTYETSTKNYKAIFTPASNLNNSTSYTATVTMAVRDMATIQLAHDSVFTFTTEAIRTDLPDIPTGLTAYGGNGQVKLDWIPSGGANDYYIYWGNSDKPSEAEVVHRTLWQGVSYPHTGLTNGTMYYYQVSARNDTGESKPSPTVSAMPGDITPPIVTSFSLGETTTTTYPVTFTASDNVGVTGYLIAQCDSFCDDPLSTDARWSPTAPTSYTVIKNMPLERTYGLNAWVKDAAGNVSARMLASKTIRDISPPTVIFDMPGDGATVNGEPFLELSCYDDWYVCHVEVLLNGVSFSSFTISSVRERFHPWFWDTTKVANGTYTWSAKAYDESGNFSQSSITVHVLN